MNKIPPKLWNDQNTHEPPKWLKNSYVMTQASISHFVLYHKMTSQVTFEAPHNHLYNIVWPNKHSMCDLAHTYTKSTYSIKLI